MNNSKIKYYVLTVLFVYSVAFSQNRVMEFNLLSTEDGLSNGNISAIIQDSLGFIWLGTAQGLNRYDGYELKKFYALPGTLNSLPDDNITSLFFSSDSILWIGTNSKGLVSYNPVTGKFTHYKELLYNADEDSYPKITKLFNEAKGSIWMATGDGRILKVNYSHNNSTVNLLSDQKIIHYSSEQNTAETVSDFCFLSESSFLVATWDGLYFCKYDGEYGITENERLTNTRAYKVKFIEQKIFLIAGFPSNYELYISEFIPGKTEKEDLQFELFYPDSLNKSAIPTNIIEYGNNILFPAEYFRLLGYTILRLAPRRFLLPGL